MVEDMPLQYEEKLGRQLGNRRPGTTGSGKPEGSWRLLHGLLGQRSRVAEEHLVAHLIRWK